MFDSLHTLELSSIHCLQQIRSPLLDLFFKSINFFDTQEFMFVLIPAVWLGYRWKEGAKLLYIVLLSVFVNYLLKELFLEPRPYHLDDSLALIRVGGYGFPSGAAQTAVLLPAILLSIKRNGLTLLIAMTFFFLVSLSRVYLGVHFPSDVVGGWFVGSLLFLVYYFVFPKVESFLKSRPMSLSYAASFLIPAALLTSHFTIPSLKIACVAFGAAFGSCLSLSLGIIPPPSVRWITTILRIGLGVIGLFCIYALLSLVLDSSNIVELILKYISIGLWFGVGGNVAWRLYDRLLSGD